MMYFAKRLIKKLIKAGSQKEPVFSSVSIDTSSMLEDTKLGDWIKIQKLCYFYKSEIGSYSYFAGFNSVMNATIGKFCSIGSFASIGPGKHPIDFVSTSPVFYSPHKQCGMTFADKSYFQEMVATTIGNDVWIGTNAVIFDGVKIGHGAVIAANAVVNKDVEPYTIVGGIPAKPLKKRFDDSTIAALLEFKWWDRDEQWLKDNFKLFHDTTEFLKIIDDYK